MLISPTVQGCCTPLSNGKGVNATLLGQEVLTIDETTHGLLGFQYLVSVP